MAEPPAAVPEEAFLGATAGRDTEEPGEPGETEETEEQARLRAERKAQRELEARRRARARCGCASPRLLRRGSEVTLGDGRALTAWLRDDGEASLTTFTQPVPGGPSTSVSAPLAELPFVVEGRGALVQTPARLLRVYASGPSEPFYLGVEIPPRKVPGDVVLATVDGAGGAPEPGPPPDVDQLWVGALTERETANCGRVVSRRVLTEAEEGAEPIAAFLVEYTPLGGETRTALVDERHARIFGLGRVEPCEHGVPLDEGPGEITVRAVGERFGVGPAWTFTLPEEPSDMPTALVIPSGKELREGTNPFLVGHRDPLDELFHDVDHAAVGFMAFVVVGAGMLAQFVYRARRKPKPFLVEIACPACEAELSLDLNAPETDGLFCPKCGRSAVYVAFGADGAPKATVVRLEKDHRPKAT